MTEAWMHFSVFVAVSLLIFVGILHYTMRRRPSRPKLGVVSGTAVVVVVVGMLFAKFASNAGWPWWIYYTVPAAVTLLLPPLVFRFRARELAWYMALAFLSSPVIHVFFSLVFGWHEYMPFIYIPSLCELAGRCSAAAG